MQRLFSTFADGWPGLGLLLQRVLIGSALVYCGIANLTYAGNLGSIILSFTGAASGVLLLVGLWTPVAGVVASVVEVWSIFLGAGDPRISISLATLAATLTMIGPGAWSLDARIFGRKQLKIPVR